MKPLPPISTLAARMALMPRVPESPFPDVVVLIDATCALACAAAAAHPDRPVLSFFTTMQAAEDGGAWHEELVDYGNLVRPIFLGGYAAESQESAIAQWVAALCGWRLVGDSEFPEIAAGIEAERMLVLEQEALYREPNQ